MQNQADNMIEGMFSRQAWAMAGDRRWMAVLNVVLALGAILLFAGYLTYNNRTAAYGFTIRDTENRISQLQDEKRRLDLDVLSRQAMGNVDSRVRDLGFVPAEKIEYMVTGPSGVALR